MAGKIIGIVSLKGGVGKTTTVANLGAVLSSEFNKKVLAIDTNFSAPNLGLHLGLMDPKVTIHDVLLNNAQAHEAIYGHESGFHFIPASYYKRKKINPYSLKKKINYLKNYYDIILLDSSPSLNEELLSTMIASDEILVVTSPDYPTLSTTLRAVKLAKQKRTPITGLILNKVRNKKFELSIEDIEKAANVPVIGVLPEDISVVESLYYTSPVSLYRPKSRFAVEFRKLAATLTGDSLEGQSFWSRFKSFFRRSV